MQKYLEKNKLDGFISLKPENIYWQTQFSGTFGMCLIQNNNQIILISDGRYAQKAQNIANKKQNLSFQLYDDNFSADFGKNITGKFAIEDSISLADKKFIQKLFPHIKLTETNQVIENLRRNKTPDEIQKIKQAQHQVDQVLYDFLTEKLKEGITEKTLAFNLEIAIQNAGEYGLSFPAIVAFGENSALPHHAPGGRKLKSGDNILIDLGTRYKHYCSDMTRNFLFQNTRQSSTEFINKNTKTQNYIWHYNKLNKAQTETLKLYKPQAKTQEIDQFSREKIGNLAEFYIHSLGHGVGLEVHELPNLSKRSSFTLQTNDIVTCEPGIYFPNKFGIRIEDLIVITNNSQGHEIISKTTKNLKIFNQQTKKWTNV